MTPLRLLLALPLAMGENPECMLATATLPRFKYETTYGWHAALANFTNVGQSSSLDSLVAFYNATQRPGTVDVRPPAPFPRDVGRSECCMLVVYEERALPRLWHV
jgi:hypothetical protein